MEPSCSLPPGFRFHPTDEELINYYLTKKVLDSTFSVRSIVDIDVNHSEPWDFRGKADLEEKEWYFFTLRDRKYPTGTRTNRATKAGYWKATGKDREVINSHVGSIVGMKKTLVFYKGRAPKGEKTNWIMHEYRLEGAASNIQFTKVANEAEWVVCRIFQKRIGGKKACLKNSNLMNFSEGHSYVHSLSDYAQQTAAEDLEGDSDTNIQENDIGYQSIVMGQNKNDHVAKERTSNNVCVTGTNYLRDGNASASSKVVEKLVKGPYSIQRIQQYSVERETLPATYTRKVERHVDGAEMERYRLMVDKSSWLQATISYEDTQSLPDVKLPPSSPLIMESFCEEVPLNLYRADNISSTEDLDSLLGS